MHEQSGEVKPAVSHGDKNFTRAIKIGASYEDGFRNFLFRNRRLISIESKIISLYDVILQLPWNVKETSKMYNYLLEDRITRKVLLSIRRTNRRKILFNEVEFFSYRVWQLNGISFFATFETFETFPSISS